jgi:hypothetical protein
MAATKSFTFTRERETKNTMRYQEDVAPGDQPAIGTLYIQKHALKDLGAAEQITVTIATP